MATFNWKTPNGTTGSIDLSKVVTSVATGSTNGTIAVNGTNVAVKGLGSAAYTNSTAYAAASHGNHVPAKQTANNKIFLRNDNTWQTVTPANIGAATSDHDHDSAYTPIAKSKGNAQRPVYTNANGVITKCTHTLSKSVPSDAIFTDHTYSNFVKSGSTAAAGLVPKPSTTAGTTHYLREDGNWTVPPNTTYSAGTAALLTAGTDTSNRVWTAKDTI